MRVRTPAWGGAAERRGLRQLMRALLESESPHHTADMARANDDVSSTLLLLDLARARLLGRSGLGARGLGGRSSSVGGCASGSGDKAGDGWAREDVGGFGIENSGIEDAGVVGAVGTGHADELAVLGRTGLASTDLDLCAAWVELGSAEAVGKVQGDDFVAEDVVSGGEVLGEGDASRLTID